MTRQGSPIPRNVTFWGAALAVLLTVSTSGVAADTPPPEETEIPLSMVGGRPQVDVLINGKGPFPFVLDTGSSLNVLDAGIAHELGLQVIGEREIGAPGMPQIPAEIVKAAGFEVHGIEIGEQEIVTMDLAGMSGGLFLGVLRFGVFAESLSTLDLTTATLTLSNGSLDPGAEGVITFNAEEGLIDIPITIAGNDFTAHVDSGSPGHITIPGNLAKDLPFREEPVVVGEARLVGGRGSASRGRLDGTVLVGPIRYEDPEVTIFDVPVPKVNLGSAFLGKHVVRIDQQRGLIHFEPKPAGRIADTGSKAPRRLGLRPVPGPPGPNGLALKDGGLPVDWVAPGGLASAAGLEKGDVVLAVNGTSLPEFDAASLIALFAGSDPLRIEVKKASSGQVEVLEIP